MALILVSFFFSARKRFVSSVAIGLSAIIL
jgi:hypothetical protein